MWFIGVELQQETSAPPPKKNPGSAPEIQSIFSSLYKTVLISVFWLKQSYKNLRFFLLVLLFLFDLFL